MSSTALDSPLPIIVSSIDAPVVKDQVSCDGDVSTFNDATNLKKRAAVDHLDDDIPASKRRCGKLLPYHQPMEEGEEDDACVAHQLLDPRLMPSTHGIIFVCQDPRFHSKHNFTQKIADWTAEQCAKYLPEDTSRIEWTAAHEDSLELEEILEKDSQETHFLFVNVKSSAERWMESTMEVIEDFCDQPNTYALIPEHLMRDDRHLRYDNRLNIPGFYDLPSARNAAFRTSTFPYGDTEWSCIPLQTIKHYFKDGTYTEAQQLELDQYWLMLMKAYTDITKQEPLYHTRSCHDEIEGQVSEKQQCYRDLCNFAWNHPQFHAKLPDIPLTNTDSTESIQKLQEKLPYTPPTRTDRLESIQRLQKGLKKMAAEGLVTQEVQEKPISCIEDVLVIAGYYDE